MSEGQIELLQRGLPKWPQMYTTGKPVTSEQAMEIIRRTDTFFIWGGGNNHEYNRWVRQTLGMPPDTFDRDWSKTPTELARAQAQAWYAKLHGPWGYLRPSYVHNSWMSSSFIGGPYGWCHPDGHIGYIDNVGKWPSVEDIVKDWEMLASAFPFLEVAATLYNGESCEEGTAPVVTILVSDAKVQLVEPDPKHHAGHPEASRRNDSTGSAVDEFMSSWPIDRREQGIPDEWVVGWGERFR